MFGSEPRGFVVETEAPQEDRVIIARAMTRVARADIVLSRE
jgi:hypothetical protein